MTAQQNLQYGLEDGSTLGFDLILPYGDGPFPLFVFLHGGGWVSGDRSMYWDEAGWAASQGWAAACITYRLAPDHPFPAAVSDVKHFLGHAHKNAQEMNIDPSRICVMGNSSGGHLALMSGLQTGVCPDEVDSLKPASVVAICPITDVTDPQDTHFAVGMSFLEMFLPEVLNPDSPLNRQASPVHLVEQSDPPPTIIFHGTEDGIVPIRQSERYAALPKSNSTFVPLEGEGHSFTYEAWMEIRSGALALAQGQ